MLIPWPGETPLPSYKSYKAQRYEKALSRIKALKQSVIDSSLKEEDKKKLLQKMKEEL
jgi:uncharacterized membrane protein